MDFTFFKSAKGRSRFGIGPSQFLTPLFGAFLLSSVALAGGPRTLAQISDGQHSYRKLGNAFAVPLEMERVDDARLLLFNVPFAADLGLDLPADPAALAKQVLDAYAHRVKKPDSPKRTSKSLFATYYQDSNTKGPGDALGDGRAAWFGEITIEQADGTVARVEVVGKGIGVTPLAWLNHAKESHKDGLMYRSEGVHDFITSEAAYRLGLETNRTLAVIEIPDLKFDESAGAMKKSVTTIRVGPQFRPAHLRYYSDQPKELRIVSEYLVRRMLRLPNSAKIGEEEGARYLEMLSEKMGEQAALYKILGAVQRNPTAGNRTLVGGAIDTGTFRILDASHPGYSIMLGRMTLSQQTEAFRGDLKRIAGYLRKSGLVPRNIGEAELIKTFERHYARAFTDGILAHLGLSEAEVRRVPKSVRIEIARAFTALFDEVGTGKLALAGKEMPASAYDARAAFAGFWDAYASGKPLKSKRAISSLLQSKTRDWQGVEPTAADALAKALTEQADAVLASLGFSEPPARWLKKARSLADGVRTEPHLAHEIFEKPIEEAIADATKSWVEISGLAQVSIEAMVDSGAEPPKESAFGSRDILERNRTETIARKAADDPKKIRVRKNSGFRGMPCEAYFTPISSAI